MLPFGHISASYLISQVSKKRLKTSELLFIIFSGNIFDLDFLFLSLLGYPGSIHHQLPGHTPLFGFLYLIVLFLIFRHKFSKEVFVLATLALFTHLILDDLSHWLFVLGLDKVFTPRQIIWLYPFEKHTTYISQINSDTNTFVLNSYLQTKLFIVEIGVVLMGVIVFIRKKLHHQKENHLQ